MSGTPAWLPAMFPVNPWTADTYDLLYAIFCRDFKFDPASYAGHRVWFFPEMDRGKEEIFWHLTDREDKRSGARYPDLERAARLPWSRPMLDHAAEPEILAWDYEEGDGTVKTYVWLKNHDYVVIMKRMKDLSRRLVTSFWIDYSNTRKKMQGKYDARLK